MREHGGNLDVAIRCYGGSAEDWIDLSTGINRRPYPIPTLSPRHWTALPSRSDVEGLHAAARQAYYTDAPILAVAGAQAAIQLLPHFLSRGSARIVAPTYNEYAGVLSAAGWTVTEVTEPEALAGADLAVVVSPNNPAGQRHDPSRLLALVARVGRLVVDESFADPITGLSIAAKAGQPGLLLLRSFGKFYGLAGLRLGFVLGSEADIAALAAMAGPWPISGVAVEIGRRALLDRDWARATAIRLSHDCVRLDRMVQQLDWTLVGGTPLFRLYQTCDARAAQKRLAQAHIWSRVFAQRSGWLRLGLPGDEAEWERLAAALKN